MMKFSAIAARYLGDIEILEMHHDNKVDAPSGTAVKTAEMISEVRDSHIQGHPDEKEHQAGARGADFEGMKIHSIRLPGLLAHQQVLLGGEGELLTIRHDSFDRKSFSCQGFLWRSTMLWNVKIWFTGLKILLTNSEEHSTVSRKEMLLEKLKVGVICYPSLGGSGVVATELGKMMADKGHEMHYITSSKPFRFLDVHPNIQFHEVKIDGYSVFKYPPYDIALANRIAEVIETEKLDLLHVHYAVPHAVSAALGKDMANSTIGVITTLHGTDVTILGHDPGLRNTVRYGIDKSTITTAVSESLRLETLELIEPKKDISNNL